MRRKKKISRKVYQWSRFFHVYFSTALFALLVWFCVTGIVLNHVDWLSGSSHDGDQQVELNTEIKSLLRSRTLTEVVNEPPIAAIQRLLKKQYNLAAVSEIVIDSEMGELVFDYKIPGGYATAILEIEVPRLMLDFRRGSWWSIMGDLHKGRHSGKGWSWVIDLSAVLMIIFSITGLVILYQNQKYRISGFVATLAGFISPVLFYWFFVPRLTGV